MTPGALTVMSTAGANESAGTTWPVSEERTYFGNDPADMKVEKKSAFCFCSGEPLDSIGGFEVQRSTAYSRLQHLPTYADLYRRRRTGQQII